MIVQNFDSIPEGSYFYLLDQEDWEHSLIERPLYRKIEPTQSTHYKFISNAEARVGANAIKGCLGLRTQVILVEVDDEIQ